MSKVALSEYRDAYSRRLRQDNLLPQYGNDGWLHPSGLWDICFRFHWLRAKHTDKVPPREIEPTKQLVFLRGNALHDAFREQVLSRTDSLLGTWRCSRCRKVVPKAGKPPVACPKEPCSCRVARHCWGESKCEWADGFSAEGRDCNFCGRWGKWEFIESHVEERRDDLPGVKGIRGKYDGVLELPSGFGVFDLKFWCAHRWSTLKAPDAKDEFQVRIYLELCKYEFDFGIISYFNVDDMTPKNFLIEPDPDFRNRLESLLRQYKEVMQTGSITMVPRVCRNERAVRAKECPFSVPCFDAKALGDGKF